MRENTYTPKEVSDLIGLSPELQRSYRHRGVQLGGAAVNGRFRFSGNDVFHAAVFMAVHRAIETSAHEAWRMTLHCAPHIAAHRKLRLPQDKIVPIYPENAVRFALFAPGQNPIMTDNLLEAVDLDSAVVTVLDLVRLSKEIPADVWLHFKTQMR